MAGASDRAPTRIHQFFLGDQLRLGKDRLRDVGEEIVRVASA